MASEASTQSGQIKSIAQRDKELMRLQQQIELKEAQVKKDYLRLKRDVKENPYLQDAVDQYDEYFTLERKKLEALKTLSKTIVSPLDQREIKKEISNLEKNLL